MKTAFLTVSIMLVSICAHAEKAEPPILVSPANSIKNIVKEGITLRWQKPNNAVSAKVYAYRLLISENSRFNGYDSQNCDNSCLLAEVDGSTFDYSTDLRLSNKVYYWKVQAVGAVENGAWSTIRTIQTQKDIVIPTISNVNVSPNAVEKGKTVTFSATLTDVLTPDYAVKVNYGDGLVKMNGSGKTFSLSVMPSNLGGALYIIGIYDSKNVLKGSSMTGNFKIVEPTSVVIDTPIIELTGGDHAFNYTKIANDGSELPKTAQLGTGEKNWACTRDNSTGLIWEVKTDDGGLHDKDSKYSWYNPNVESKGSFRSYEYQKWCKASNCDTYGFVNAVNDERLCGLSDWRMPEKEELMSLVYCSDGKYDDDDGECSSYQKVQRPTIESKYFAFTHDSSYWTATQNLYGGVFYVGFDEGIGYSGSKSSGSFVRLVHDGR